MKKIAIFTLLAVLIFPIVATHKQSVPTNLSELQRMSIDHLEYGLCLTFWDPKFWGINARRPVEQARLIHEQLIAKVKEVQAKKPSANFEAVGKKLDKEYDAKIVHQCAKLEQRKRETDSYGTMRVTQALLGRFPVRFNAQTFYQNACSCDNFYQTLTNEQLAQLYKGTMPEGFKDRVWDKIK